MSTIEEEEEENPPPSPSGSQSNKTFSTHLPQIRDSGHTSPKLRSRCSSPNASGQIRPRSISAMNSTLHRIDEDSTNHYVRPHLSLCRHGSLMTIGKENGNFRNGNLRSPLSIHSRKLSLSESFRTNFRPREFLKGRLSGRSRYRNRLVQKGGYCNISLVNVPKQRRKYFSDIFTTLVDVKWRWCLLVFALSFLITWLVFSVIYYLIALAHGDFLHIDNENWTPCIQNGRSYLAILIFSIASQHTIGWGYRYPTEECPEVLFTICIQSIVGVMIQTLMAGVVFAKLARPKKRAETLIFSKNAVVCMQDGNLCFLFRVGDMRKSQLAEAHVRVQMIRNRITDEGELLPFHQYDMDVGFDTGTDRVFVVWPITICHVINENSPLYQISQDELVDARFEIVVILEGVVESTGATTQARTSYLPSEILWGHRFEKLVTYQRENGNYRIDFGRFHLTYPVHTTPYSACELDKMREAGFKPEEAFKCAKMEEVENMGATPYTTIHAGETSGPHRPLISQIFEKRLKDLEGREDNTETV